MNKPVIVKGDEQIIFASRLHAEPCYTVLVVIQLVYKCGIEFLVSVTTQKYTKCKAWKGNLKEPCILISKIKPKNGEKKPRIGSRKKMLSTQNSD